MTAAAGGGDGGTLRRTGLWHWSVRGLAALAMVAGAVYAVRRHRPSAEQEELRRYVELTVPALLEEVAACREQLESLDREASPARARARLVDEITPRLVRLRRRTGEIPTVSAAVRSSNDELAAAVDALLEVSRVGVRAVDDPDLDEREGLRRVREQRQRADALLRGWMEHLRAACASAGFEIAGPPGGGGERPGLH